MSDNARVKMIWAKSCMLWSRNRTGSSTQIEAEPSDAINCQPKSVHLNFMTLMTLGTLRSSANLTCYDGKRNVLRLQSHRAVILLLLKSFTEY